MAMPIQDIIKREEQKCDENKLEQVISLIQNGKGFSDIMREADLSSFDLSTYLEVAFYQTNLDPSILVDKERITKIMSELNQASFPSLKAIKTKYPDYEYTEIRIVRGVYFRTTHYYQKKTKPKKTEEMTQMTLFGESGFQIDEPKVEKVDLTTVPFLLEALDTLETEHWKQFALELFAKFTPKQFYIMPASMSKKQHHETEQSVGCFDPMEPKKLLKMGGKYYHSYRVYLKLLEIIEPDHPEIWNWRKTKVVRYVYGFEYEPWQRDAMKVAALSHDIFSGGTGDEFDSKRKYLDKHHAHYHKTELVPLKKMVPDNEWDAYIIMVDNHMAKWDPVEPSMKFHDGKTKETVTECYEHYVLYRMMKNVELADYLASRRNDDMIARLKQAVETWFYLKGNLEIDWSDLENIGLPEADIRQAFAKEHESLQVILELVFGGRFSQMKNQSLMQ